MEQIEIPSNNNIIKKPNHQTANVRGDDKELSIYFAFGSLCFSTAVFLLGLINFYNYNPLMLSIYGFIFPGCGQILTSIKAYQFKHYIDGNVYFFFALNWFANFFYELFPKFGWIEPLNNIEYGIHNLMATLFVFVFFIQNLFGDSNLLKVFFFFTFNGFLLSTIGYFIDSITVKKLSGIFNFITAAIGYYYGYGIIINQKKHKNFFPFLAEKRIGPKLN